MNILVKEVSESKKRCSLRLVSGLLLAIGIGLVIVEFNPIKTLFKPASPVEIAEQTVLNGNEQQRLETLNLIIKDRLLVDVEILKRVFASDASLNVRKLALKTILYRMERPMAKKFLEQILPLETDPEILQMIDYRLQELSEEISWLYKE